MVLSSTQAATVAFIARLRIQASHYARPAQQPPDNVGTSYILRQTGCVIFYSLSLSLNIEFFIIIFRTIYVRIEFLNFF